MSSKRVTDFFQPKVSKYNERVNTNLQNVSMEQENDPRLNENQNEEAALKEGELFHPPKHYVFPNNKE